MTEAAPTLAATTTTAPESVATTAPSATPAALGDWRDTIPEKFRTVGEDGSVSLNGEAAVKSYLHLEQRQGKFGMPVDNPDSYARPDGIDDEAWAATAEMRKGAVENGLTGKQFDYHAAQIQAARESVAAEIIPSIDQARVAFKELHGGDESAMNKGLGLAQKAAKAYGIDLNDPFVGNNANLMFALAKVGGELGADGSIHGAVLSGTDLQSLRSNPAYMDDSHPEHKVIRERVRQHYLAADARK